MQLSSSSNAHKGPAYRVETARLVIRCWQPADAPLQARAIAESVEHLREWMPWAENEPDPDLDRRVERNRFWRGRFDLNQDFVYGIFNLEETQVLGGTGLHTRVGPDALEIGYWIHVDHINQGLATETAAALTRVAFEIHQVDRVEIHCDQRNVRSAAVPRKLGYTLDGVLRHRRLHTDRPYLDTMLWTLLSTEYPGSQAKVKSDGIRGYDVLGKSILD